MSPLLADRSYDVAVIGDRSRDTVSYLCADDRSHLRVILQSIVQSSYEVGEKFAQFSDDLPYK